MYLCWLQKVLKWKHCLVLQLCYFRDRLKICSNLINSRVALVLRGCDVLQWRIREDGATRSSECCKVQRGSLGPCRVTSAAKATGPGTMVSAWLSMGFSCCGISLDNSLSHKPCGLFELCRWATAGLENCPSVCRTGHFAHICCS